MPRRDGTGPDGQGSKTGRKLGNCEKKENPQSNRLKRGLRDMGIGRWKIVNKPK